MQVNNSTNSQAGHFYVNRGDDIISRITAPVFSRYSNFYKSINNKNLRGIISFLPLTIGALAVGFSYGNLIKRGFKFASATFLARAIFINKVITPAILLFLVHWKCCSIEKFLEFEIEIELENIAIAAELRAIVKQNPELPQDTRELTLKFCMQCEQGNVYSSKEATYIKSELIGLISNQAQIREDSLADPEHVQGILNLLGKIETANPVLPKEYKEGIERFRSLAEQGVVTCKDSTEMLGLNSSFFRDLELQQSNTNAKGILDLVKNIEEKHSPLPDELIREIEVYKGLVVDKQSVHQEASALILQKLYEFLDTQEKSKRFHLETNPDHRRQLAQEAEKVIENAPNFLSALMELVRVQDMCDSPLCASIICSHKYIIWNTQRREELAQLATEDFLYVIKRLSLEDQNELHKAVESIQNQLEHLTESMEMIISQLISGLKKYPDLLSEEMLRDLLKTNLSHEKLNSLLEIAVCAKNLLVIQQLLNQDADLKIVPDEILMQIYQSEIEQIVACRSIMKINKLDDFRTKLDQIAPQMLEELVLSEQSLSDWIKNNMALALTLATHTKCTPRLQKRLFESGSRVYKNAFLCSQPVKFFLAQYYSQEMPGWSGAFFGKVYNLLKEAKTRLPAELRFRKKLLADMQAHFKQKEGLAWREECFDQILDEHIYELDD